MANKTSTFLDNNPPKADAIWLNMVTTEIKNLVPIDGSTIDSSGTTNDQAVNAIKNYVSQAGILCTDAGSTNAYSLSASSPFTNPQLKTGCRVRFKTANPNTGASTITAFGGSAIACRKSDGTTPLSAGDIPANTEVEFVYDGTSWVQAFNGNPATTTTKGITFLNDPITIANNATDANNDIDFSAGVMNFTNGSGQALATALTKRLDASWSAGTNQGGLFTGTKANSTWYHCFTIWNPTTSTYDAGFDTSITASNKPSGYTNYEYRGSVLTDGSGNIRGFIQNKNWFLFKTPILQYSGTPATTETTLTTNLPLGFNTIGIFSVYYNLIVGGGARVVRIYSYDADNATLSFDTSYGGYGNSPSASIDIGGFSVFAMTNLSSQVKYKTDKTWGLGINLQGYINNNIKF